MTAARECGIELRLPAAVRADQRLAWPVGVITLTALVCTAARATPSSPRAAPSHSEGRSDDEPQIALQIARHRRGRCGCRTHPARPRRRRASAGQDHARETLDAP